MVEQDERRVAVGTYMDEDRAENAAASLRESDFTDIAVEEISDGVWQVLAPRLDARRALEELHPEEQRGMQTHF